MNRRIYKLRIMHRMPLVLATALLTSVSAFAQTEISTEAQLKAIANNLSGTYVLKNDITLSDDEWTPIGTSDHPFTGTLDGQGHTIIGLTVGNGVQDQTNNNKAFFGFTNGATVTNIAFTSAVVKGYEQAAIVVAQATSSTLSNIYVSGVVTGRDHVGTIAGDARGTTDKRTQITNCVSTAAALSTEHQGGGIAGWTNNSIFSYNIAYGAVTAPQNGAGGITGMVDNDGNTEYKSNISAAPYIKGHADHTRGINGWCNNNCSNTNSGGNLSWAGTEYYLGETKTEANKISDGTGIHGTVTTTEDLKKVTTYTGLGFDTNTWELTEGQSPRLKMFPNISDAVSISGLPDIITKGQTVTVTAKSALNRPIEIISSDRNIISVDGNTLKAENYGTCDITFAESAGDFVPAASKTVTITVPGLQVTYHIGDNSEAVTSEVSAVGSLATLLGGEDNAMKVTQLSVKGYLNDQDIITLQRMAGHTQGKGSLKSLNLSEATFTKTGKKVPDNIFQNCKNLQQVNLSNMTEIGQWAFQNSALTEISIPATVTKIGVGAFSGNSAVTKVTVSSTQIDARSYDGEDNIFSGMDPNKVQVVFKDAAEYNYKNYRNDIKDGNNVYKNAFMYLLTKTLDENSTDYTVVPQRHADVRLYRTFKEGWNTLVLPFGARYLENDPEPSCSSIFQRALNASGNKDFMIAAYRGLSKKNADSDNRTFYFLKYADYNNDPLDEFEPLLIRMTQDDIDDANKKGGVYTFKNVELNFDGDFEDPNNDKIKIYKEYTAAEAKERMGKRENGKYFDGSYDQTANDKFNNSSYDEFYFTGTLYKQQGTASENSAFIAPGDYIIQNNTFVKCFLNKTYGLKGFRGYFKQKPSGGTSGGQSGAKGIGICLVDSNGVVSSIHQVDGVSLTSASVAPVAVYNLSGQKVGNSLSTLAKGVYIVNGKKFVKK
ncbi:MAG: leucine-rich repeat protein [Prevotella sp.]